MRTLSSSGRSYTPTFRRSVSISSTFTSRSRLVICIHLIDYICFLYWAMVMIFNATFNNSSDISWWSVLLVEEIGEPGENDRPAAGH